MTEKDNLSLITIEEEKEYENLIESRNLSVLLFFTPWSEQSTQMCDAIEEMVKLEELKGTQFAKISAEDFPSICIKENVLAVPTVIFYKSGKAVDRVDGVNPMTVVEKAKKYLLIESDKLLDQKSDNLEARLKKLINQARCMLFMKGNPTNPRCGFSKTIVALLNSYNTDYQTFDILEDNEVREGLKKFSEWPTYPQLYIDGELIGGLDIVREMSEDGSLEKILPKKSFV